MLAALGLALAASPASVSAEQPTITAQARAANAEFLAFAPPPPDGAGAVCLVDTGVDLNPDTESNVIERLALDGGDPGDVHHSKHGTGMAMVMGGPVNDWGSVGIWPHVRIVSVRAMPPGESSFPFNYYKRAVDRCRSRLGAGIPIRAVNLSLGGVDASPHEASELRDYFIAAHADGLNVVAAAGNDGDSVQYPAAIREALAVGASEGTGGFCTFSSRGPGLDLVAPGCGNDVALADGQPAYGNGTSESSAIVAAVIAALRSYRPDLGAAEAESLLLSTAGPAPAGPAIDVEALFRAAGLAEIVDAGHAAAPREPAMPPRNDPTRRSVGPGDSRLPRPRLTSWRYTRHRLTLRVANRPPDAWVVARLTYDVGTDEFRRRDRTVKRAANTMSLRVPTRWSRVELAYRSRGLEPSRRLVVMRRSLAQSFRSNKRPRS